MNVSCFDFIQCVTANKNVCMILYDDLFNVSMSTQTFKILLFLSFTMPCTFYINSLVFSLECPLLKPYVKLPFMIYNQS